MGDSIMNPNSELTYFSKSRRQFLKLSSLTIGGLVLSGTWPPKTTAQDDRAPVRPIRIDRAIAWALQDAGISLTTHVPATGATDIFDAHNKLVGTKPSYAFNEEVAYTIAHSAALAGVRSAAIIKSHGLAKAGNSVIDSLTLGNTAGFVAIVLDDPEGRHSDSVFDLKTFLQGTGIPFKISRRETIYNDVLESYLWSEELGIPVALLVNSEMVSLETTCELKRLRSPEAKFRRDPWLHVLCPPLAGYQHKVFQARLARMKWQEIARPQMPPIPKGLPPHWRSEAERFVPVFEVFQEMRPKISVACGDTGLSSLFAFPPFACIDTCSYYGGSLPMAIGFHLGGFDRPWAVTGDYAFLAAGHMGLIEALALGVPLKVLIMDNGHAMATGGQPIPPGVYEQLLNGWRPFVTQIRNPEDRSAIKDVLSRAIESSRIEIISVRFRS
ncbi:MAG: hypothetical protein FJ130_05895 [Deltaproteobacteria bacterium]|nr:hypothetical protein [Deltaproteobacteria bacterium]